MFAADLYQGQTRLAFTKARQARVCRKFRLPHAFFQAAEVSVFVVSSFLVRSTGKCGCFHVDTSHKKVEWFFYWLDQLTNSRLSHQHLSMQVFESQVVERRIAEQFRGDMSRGVCPLGSKLPPRRDLAKSLDVSGPSMREALIAHEVASLIEVCAGSGIYVRPIATRFMQLGSIGPSKLRVIPFIGVAES